MRLFFGARYVGAVVGIDAVAPSTLDYAGTRAKVQRVPVSVRVRGRLFARRFAFSLDAVRVPDRELRVHDVERHGGLDAAVDLRVEVKRYWTETP